MNHDLSDDMRAVVVTASQRGSERIRVVSDGRSYGVCRYWKSGFSMEAGAAAGLRGLVEIYDGVRHLGTGLIVAQGVERGIRSFAFKRFSPPLKTPPVDFVVEGEAEGPEAWLAMPERAGPLTL